MALTDRAVSFDLWSAFGAIQTWAWEGTIGLSRSLSAVRHGSTNAFNSTRTSLKARGFRLDLATKVG